MAEITRANAGFVSDETVSVFAFDQFMMATPRMPTLYNMQNSSSYREVSASMSGLGEFEEKGELQAPTEDRTVQQFKQEFLHQEFALGVTVERKVYEDQRFGFFQQLGTKIGQSAMRTFETQGAKVFNEAFSSSTYLAEDGKTLCNGTHVNVDAGNSQSNTGTSSLTYDNVGTTMTAMQLFTDYRGNPVLVDPDLLLVPVSKEQAAFEIIRSSGDPTEANLKANYFNGRLSALTWRWLDVSDVNNWFLIDSMLMKENLYWYWRIALEIFGDGDAWIGKRRIGGYYRSSHKAVGWWWIYGQNASS